MREPRAILTLAVVAVIVAACGSSTATATPTPTAADGGGGGGATPTLDTGGGGGGGGATPTPATGGGGGTKPAGWDQYGTVHFDITGPVTRSGDLGFIPAGSMFSASGTSLSFTIDGTDTILTIVIAADKQASVSYGDPGLTVPGTQCTTSNLNLGATSASGGFDCTAPLMFAASGAALSGGKITGTFDAHA